ncbi:hypothetical protein GKE82_26350 [Conexibacter sp. W3-3-2]|uniref:hypothetical protein n=1 Tax=Conexibacter sp. W3-3-2 TaxID=2675227 RepID=UPI0012B9632A|nr:hypothetical protein [Conexibacter sp. W3-3-2]MTD47638.1 hypothetical protein [Conexibacter sp. W3-3-2]MTD47726.1 hypothetical protein [Conexibacter sp. W3-3-2]
MPLFESQARKDLQDWGVSEEEALDVAATGKVTYEHYVSPYDGWTVREKTIDGRRISLVHSNDDRITRVRVLSS